MAESVYFLCALTSLACAILLWRAYSRSRTKLLLWSSLCFMCLTVNNALLFADKVVFPDLNFTLARSLIAVAGLLLLLYGLVWDSE